LRAHNILILMLCAPSLDLTTKMFKILEHLNDKHVCHKKWMGYYPNLLEEILTSVFSVFYKCVLQVCFTSEYYKCVLDYQEAESESKSESDSDDSEYKCVLHIGHVA
jgi:hypothetical protein